MMHGRTGTGTRTRARVLLLISILTLLLSVLAGLPAGAGEDATQPQGSDATADLAEDPPAEDPPAEDPPAEDPPAEDPPAEDPPAEDPEPQPDPPPSPEPDDPTQTLGAAKAGPGSRATRNARTGPLVVNKNDFTITFRALTPTLYSHATGAGGSYSGGVLTQLEQSDFACGEKVVFVTRIQVDAGSDASSETLRVTHTFDTEPTGQPGVGYSTPVGTGIETLAGGSTGGDPGASPVSQGAGGGTVTVVTDVTGLDPGDDVVLRLIVPLVCTTPYNPTGNLLAKYGGAVVQSIADAVPGGAQTVPMQPVGAGELTIVKAADPEGNQSFEFDPSANLQASNFTLVDDGTATDTKIFGSLPPAIYTVDEVNIPAGWTLTDIVCSGDSDSTVTIGASGDFDPGDEGVSVDLISGEDIVCTFHDTQRAQPSLSTTPDPTSGTVGDTLNDVATLSGGNSPTGTITFKLFPPGDTTCSGTPAFTEGVNVGSGNGNYSTTTGHVANAPGTWRWTADYSGDANNASASSGCQDELVTVGQAQPSLTTTPDPTSGTVGDTLNDSATLSGGYNPTGTITFKLFPPSDPTCSGNPSHQDVVNVAGNGNYDTATGSAAGAAGIWNWTADYSGDTNNASASSGCGDEQVTVVDVGAAPLISVVKTNDANGDGVFSNSEVGEEGETVDFRLAITNPGVVPVVLDSIVDEFPGFSFDVCGSLIGTVVPPGDTVECFFSMLNYVPEPGDARINTVTVAGHDENDPQSDVGDADTSRVGSLAVAGDPPTTPSTDTTTDPGLATTGLPVLVLLIAAVAFLGTGSSTLVVERRSRRRRRRARS